MPVCPIDRSGWVMPTKSIPNSKTAFSTKSRRRSSPPCGGGSLEVDGIIDVSIYDLNIVEQVPEPATWAAMLLGMTLLGATLRMRRAARAPA